MSACPRCFVDHLWDLNDQDNGGIAAILGTCVNNLHGSLIFYTSKKVFNPGEYPWPQQPTELQLRWIDRARLTKENNELRQLLAAKRRTLRWFMRSGRLLHGKTERLSLIHI